MAFLRLPPSIAPPPHPPPISAGHSRIDCNRLFYIESRSMVKGCVKCDIISLFWALAAKAHARGRIAKLAKIRSNGDLLKRHLQKNSRN